jgi:hypothetical protein
MSTTGGLMSEKTPPEPPADEGMTEDEKEEMVDQMEEFEGPTRREVRGEEEKPPPGDPGVASS